MKLLLHSPGEECRPVSLSSSLASRSPKITPSWNVGILRLLSSRQWIQFFLWIFLWSSTLFVYLLRSSHKIWRGSAPFALAFQQSGQPKGIFYILKESVFYQSLQPVHCGCLRKLAWIRLDRNFTCTLCKSAGAWKFANKLNAFILRRRKE